MAGRDVHFVKQTPTFIKNFKNQIGYKEPDNVESKFKELEKGSKEDEDDRDCEKPAVVLGSNVTEEEANEFLTKRQEEDCDDFDDGENDNDNKDTKAKVEQEGKFTFQKPKKRKSEETSKEKDNKKKLKDKHKTTMKSSSKAVKNASLLSFGDEEED